MIKYQYALLLAAIILFSNGCGGNNTASNVNTERSPKTGTDQLLDSGTAVLQAKTPLKRFNAYLDGFHFYSGNIQAQMEAHHYVSQLNDDIYQAAIFDGNGPDAKIMGVEYIISARLFSTLPRQEKLIWHSHRYEVKSGELIAPGLPDIAEHKLMQKLVLTYGKTIHTWHTDQDRDLPVGTPMLMMGFTEDGQINPRLLAGRDKRFKVNTAEKKQNRINIEMPTVGPDANAWQKGIGRQFILTTNTDSAMHKHQMPVNSNKNTFKKQWRLIRTEKA